MVCAVKRLSGRLYICGFCLEIKKDTVLIQGWMQCERCHFGIFVLC
ncbi:hypothetical protein HanPI659440_Chr14g0573111 [Helianthus annuus]|nr:hypothetical protein HanPI659440_Chr14g0573111 [Helianthus annuus]